MVWSVNTIHASNLNEFRLALTTSTTSRQRYSLIHRFYPSRSELTLSVVTLTVAVHRQRGQHTAHKVPHSCRRLSLGRGLQVLREGGRLARQHAGGGLGGGGALAEVLQGPLGEVLDLQRHRRRVNHVH
jgi:hypothetical protein